MTQLERPTVTLKIATSLDARIATSSGQSQWITCEQSRTETHKLRAEHEAVLVGIGTVLADDPMLTARTEPMPNKQPFRIVADTALRTPLTSQLVKTASQYRTILASGLDVDEECERPFLAKQVDVWGLPIAPGGGVSVRGLLHRCFEEGIHSVFLEGGGQLAASFLKADMVDKVEWFRAPIMIGGDGLPCFASLGVEILSDAPRWKRMAVQECGVDIWERYSRVSE